MRASTALLALPALGAAQQFPLVDQIKGFFAKASDSVSSAVPAAASSAAAGVQDIPNPVAAGTAKIAEVNVQRLTLDNHKDVLKPGAATASPGIEEWMIFATGGNKTCYGQGQRAVSKAEQGPKQREIFDVKTNCLFDRFYIVLYCIGPGLLT